MKLLKTLSLGATLLAVAACQTTARCHRACTMISKNTLPMTITRQWSVPLAVMVPIPMAGHRDIPILTMHSSGPEKGVKKIAAAQKLA